MELVVVIIIVVITIIITRAVFVCYLVLYLKTDLPQVCARSQSWRHFPALGLPTVRSGNNRRREDSVSIRAAQDHGGTDVSPYPNPRACGCHTFSACKDPWLLMEETHKPQGPSVLGKGTGGTWTGCLGEAQ